MKFNVDKCKVRHIGELIPCNDNVGSKKTVAKANLVLLLSFLYLTVLECQLLRLCFFRHSKLGLNSNREMHAII